MLLPTWLITLPPAKTLLPTTLPPVEARRLISKQLLAAAPRCTLLPPQTLIVSLTTLPPITLLVQLTPQRLMSPPVPPPPAMPPPSDPLPSATPPPVPPPFASPPAAMPTSLPVDDRGSSAE